VGETPPIAKYDQAANDEATASAEDTLPGPTSKDLYTGYGHPSEGQTSRELRSQGGERHGLVGVGADPRNPVREFGWGRDHPKGGVNVEDRSALMDAEKREPVKAEELAAELK
jgi:hypothetical protein